MSSSIEIPKRKQPIRSAAAIELVGSGSSASPSSNVFYSSSTSSSPSSYPSPHRSSTPGKAPVHAGSPVSSERAAPRRASLLGSSLSKSEYTVINLGHSDGPPRLVTCVKSSQGFDWNQELFLPSYIDYETQELERRQNPVQDIILTDEEAASILP